MDWRRNASNGWEAYAYVKGRPINFQVTLDGRYSGIINNTDHRTRETRPELYVTGKYHTPEEARSYIESLINKLNNKSDTKDTEGVLTTVEKAEEDSYVQKLAETLDEQPIEETVEEVIKEAPSDLPSKANPAPQDNLSDDKETDVADNESPVESGIFFIVDGNMMTITSSVEGVIKYTTNGREVNVSSKIYKEPFSVDGVEKVLVKVYDAEKNVLCGDSWVNSTN